MKIAVLLGGISSERNVSYAGGKAVIDALRGEGHTVVPIDPAFGNDLDKQAEIENTLNDISKFPTLEDLSAYPQRNIIDCINSTLFDDIECAFIVLHGPNGEDGMIQAVLELRGIPYTGSGIRASATAINKSATKLIMEASGVPTPEWAIIKRDDLDNFNLYENIIAYLGNDVIVKPSNQGSTIGISRVSTGNVEDMYDACKLAAKYTDTVLIEKYISGREITVTIINNKAYPVIEIQAETGFYDYDAKYAGGETQYICPADIPSEVAEAVQQQALLLNDVLGCRGFIRIDFRLDNDMQAFCLEVNTIPGFTSRSLVPMAAKAEGIEFPELCEAIIDIALDEQLSKAIEINNVRKG
jgi:D-alanine-D-alanine ligase